jgi:hypothetical protein
VTIEIPQWYFGGEVPTTLALTIYKWLLTTQDWLGGSEHLAVVGVVQLCDLSWKIIEDSLPSHLSLGVGTQQLKVFRIAQDVLSQFVFGVHVVRQMVDQRSQQIALERERLFCFLRGGDIGAHTAIP